jgi:site-specific recombinase XerD
MLTSATNYPLPSTAERLKGLESYQTWLNRRYRMNTIRTQLGSTGRFIQWCETENINAEQCTYSELLDFIRYCNNRGNVKRTIGLNITAIKNWFNFLIETGIRDENPAAELRIRNQTYKAASDIINYPDLENLYNYFPAKGIVGKRNKSLLGLIIYQGLTIRELQELEVNDIKLQEGKIYIPGVGRSNDRTLKLESHQIVQLQNYVLQIRPVIIAMSGKQTDKLLTTIGKSLRLGDTLCKLMEQLREVHPTVKNPQHLRASVIAHWYKLHNTRQVQYMAGHRYVSSTERYRTDKLESLQEQLEKMHPTQ